MEVSAEDVGKALLKYYKALNKEKEYFEEDNRGQFEAFCHDNGVDAELLADELNGTTNIDDMTVVDFHDDKFPFPPGQKPIDDDARKQYIFQILRQCYDNPDRSWDHLTNGLPSFDKKLFESVQIKDIEECKKLLKDQCPAIYNQGMNTDVGLLQIISISSKYQFDYLQHLVDMYDRDRVRILKQNGTQSWPIASWVQKGNNPHLKALAKLHVPRLAKPKKNEAQTISALELAQAAIHSFGHRIVSKILFNSMKKIDDLIAPTLMYINSALDFIVNLIESKSKLNELVCPFQFDLCIAVGAPIEINNNEEEEEDEESDDDDDTPNEAAPGGPYQDYIGDIQKKLKANDLKHINETIQDPDDSRRAFRESFEALRKSVEDDEKQKDKYPYRKRFISIIDRRESKKNNDLKDNMFLYEPPKGIHTRDIPQSEASEWYISATRTCLLPNIKYDANAAIGNSNPNHKDEQKKDKKPEEDTNIQASFHCKGGLLTFSFHVKAIDQIKCYLFWNGQMIRCFADEIFWVLPQLFDMEKEENKTFIKGEDFGLLVKNMSEKLKDRKYKAFVNM